MAPTPMETSPIDWPLVIVGEQRLIVRWTFYAQWLLSKRKIDIRMLPKLMAEKTSDLIDIMVEIFAATVAENFTSRGMAAPTADQWAAGISAARESDPTVWNRINAVIWEAVGKAKPAPPQPLAMQDPAKTTGSQQQTQ